MPELVTVPPYARAPRVYGISLVLVHATRGNASMAAQYAATKNYFASVPDMGGWAPNADVLIGAGGEIAEFGDWRTTRANWSAGFGFAGPPAEHGADEHAWSIELAQPASGEAYTEACIASFIAYVRPVLQEFNLPATRVLSWDQLTSQPVPRGLIGHEDTANGKRFGKSDPGALFPWARVLVELAATPSTPPPTDVLDLTVPAPRVEREMTSRYLGYNRALGREEHEIVIREYVYRPAP